MRKNLYDHGAATTAQTLPLGVGGSSATSPRQALENLGGIASDSSILIPLDSNAKVKTSLFGTQTSPFPTIDGELSVASSTEYTYTITNYDNTIQYIVDNLVNLVLVSFVNSAIVVRTNSNLQTNDDVRFSLNGRTVNLSVLSNAVAKPTVLFPTNNSTEINTTITLQTSTFNFIGDADTFVNAQWELSTNALFSTVLYSLTRTNYTLPVSPTNGLTWETDYYVRVRHLGTSGRLSDWSNVVHFKTKAAPEVPLIAIKYGSASSGSILEGNSGTTLLTTTVSRSGSYLVDSSSVNWNLTLVTANSSDFAAGYAASGVITFASGETSKQLSINIKGDTVYESNETFKFVLSGPTNGALVSGSSQVLITITNDDLTPELNASAALATTAEPIEGSKNVDFYIDRTRDPNSACSVTWTLALNSTTTVEDFLANSDFTGVALFSSGELRKTISFKLINDLNFEATDTFTFTISQPVGSTIGVSTATTNVTETTFAVLAITANQSTYNEPASGTTTASFTVTRSVGVLSSCSVDWAADLTYGGVTSSDITGASSGTLTFAANELTKTINIQIVQDNLTDNDWLLVQLSNPVNCKFSSQTAFTQIVNTELPVVSIHSYDTVDVPELDPVITFQIVRSAPYTNSCSVGWSITPNGSADFVETTGTATFAAGDAYVTIVCNRKNFKAMTASLGKSDGILPSALTREGNRTYEVWLDSPVNCVVNQTNKIYTINILEVNSNWIDADLYLNTSSNDGQNPSSLRSFGLSNHLSLWHYSMLAGKSVKLIQHSVFSTMAGIANGQARSYLHELALANGTVNFNITNQYGDLASYVTTTIDTDAPYYQVGVGRAYLVDAVNNTVYGFTPEYPILGY